jgi:uncharacterized RDD family membrane protein YckC
MNWFYVETGQQVGPVDDAQLEELVRAGRIQVDTLVWHEGMANWQPYHYVKPGGAAPAAGQPAPAVDLLPDQAVCSECGGVFNIQDTIPYGNLRVCAKCKPVFMQKLAEGARLNPGQMAYSGFWLRFGAVALDWLILYVVNTAINLIAGFGFYGGVRGQSTAFSGLFVVVLFVEMTIGLLYETVMIGRYGATLGKMACKIRVVTAEGTPVSYLRSLGRYFAKILSGMICLIGYIMAGFDEEKRALHDRICDTRVIVNR